MYFLFGLKTKKEEGYGTIRAATLPLQQHHPSSSTLGSSSTTTSNDSLLGMRFLSSSRHHHHPSSSSLESSSTTTSCESLLGLRWLSSNSLLDQQQHEQQQQVEMSTPGSTISSSSASLQDLNDDADDDNDHANSSRQSPSPSSYVYNELDGFYYSADPNNANTVTNPCSTTNHNHPIQLHIDDAMERLSMGRFQYRILALAGLLLSFDSIANVILSFLSKYWYELESQQQDDVTDSNPTVDLAWMVLPAAVAGAFVLGLSSDLLGRRVVMVGSVSKVATTIGLLGIGMAVIPSVPSTYQWFYGTAFWMAFQRGGLTVVYDLVAEVLPTAKSRGTWLIALQLFGTIGSLVVHLVIPTTTVPLDDDSTATINSSNNNQEMDDEETNNMISTIWPQLVALCAIPCIGCTILSVLYVPESPRWLVAKGKNGIAVQVLQKASEEPQAQGEPNTAIAIRHHRGRRPCQRRQRSQVFPNHTVLYSNEPKETVWDICNLCSSRWTKLTAILWSIYVGRAFLDHGTLTLAVSVFAHDHRQQNFQAVFHATAELCGVVLAMQLVNHTGRIVTQCFAYAYTGICCLLISLWVNELQQEQGMMNDILLGFTFLARIFLVCGSNATYLSTVEVLTTEIRTSRHAMTHMVGHVGGYMASLILVEIGLAMSVWCVMAVKSLPETYQKEMGGLNYTIDTSTWFQTNNTTASKKGRNGRSYTPTTNRTARGGSKEEEQSLLVGVPHPPPHPQLQSIGQVQPQQPQQQPHQADTEYHQTVQRNLFQIPE